ncbi:MAG: hypothetical protein JST11_28575 [Acidobacteria bacterium]|nr:hypothetical protein [Acidobacteriota bacterium]
MRRLAGVATVGLLLAAALGAAPAIGTVTVTPMSIVAGVATQVTFTAAISDPSVIPSSVNVQRRDDQDRFVSILGTMHDDGQNGDATAADGIYTLRTTLTIATTGTVIFKVSAAFHGSPLRTPSTGIDGTVTGSSGPVVITITSPSNLGYTNITPTTVTGTVAGNVSSVNINDVTTPVSNGRFSAAVPLREGPNYITATATVGGTADTATVQETLDTTPPHVAVTQPADGSTTTANSVDVTGIVNDIVVGTVNSQQATVTVNGMSANVSNRTFVASNVPLNVGANPIQVVATDRVGNSTTISITVNRAAPAPNQIRYVSGNNQSGAILTQLAAPLVVQLFGADGNPAGAGVPVVFRVTQNNGLVSNGGAPVPSLAVSTDANGKAQVNWTLGGRAGDGGNNLEATSAGYTGTVVFTATGAQGGPHNIVVDTGDGQVAATGQPLPRPLIAVVVDGGNNRLSNVPVTFTVTAGGGNIGGQSSYTVNTDGDGRAAATLTLGPADGSNSVYANFPGNPGATAAVFTAWGRTPGDAANTTITGVVLDNANQPIQGVTVRAVLNSQLTANAQIVGSLPYVQSDAHGLFTVTGAPVGYVKLLVDGSTANRPGTTFPTLDYDMVTVSGQNNTVGLPIYLPALSNNVLCVTENTGGGTLTMPEAPGFSLTFGPGQVTFPGGSKSGCVSVSLVHTDRMPMVPGFGQQPRFLVTIQPSGALFSPPAPLSMPNVDGLPPHAVTEMYSYDHDISAFVAIGTGTVSADGMSIVSNPGVGVIKAGWHCGGNPNSSGTAATCPQCQTCNGNACVPNPGASCDDGKFCTSANGTTPGPDQCVNGSCQGRAIADQDNVGGQQQWDFSGLASLIKGTAEVLNFAPGCRATAPSFSGAINLTGSKICCESSQSIVSALKYGGQLQYQLPGVECFVPGLSVNLEYIGVGVSVGVALAGNLTGTGTSSNCQGACGWQVSGGGQVTLTGSVRVATIIDPAYLSAAIGVQGQGTLQVQDACDQVQIQACAGPVQLFGNITLAGFIQKQVSYTIPNSQICTP